MENNFSISVIIPVYNCDRYLGEAIESVLKQTYQPSEIIIIDDGSTDKSAEVAKSFGDLIKYELQENGGAATARNRGTELATGDYFAFLDADDLWTENKLKLQIEAFNKNPQLDMVFGYVEQFHSPELPDNIKSKIYCPSGSMKGHHVGTMMIKRDALFRIGKFDENLNIADFIDWYLKATQAGLQSFMLPEVLLKRRLHDTNMSIRQRDFRKNYVRILKAHLDRRRAAQKNN